MPQRHIRHPAAGTARHDPRYLAIRWKPGVTPEAKADLLNKNGLLPAATGLENRRPLLNVNHTQGLSWVESRRRGEMVDEAAIRELEASAHVAWVALAFHEGAGGAPFAVNPTRLYLSQHAVAVTGSIKALNAGLIPDDERPSRIPGWVALKVAGASTANGNTAVEAARAAEKSVQAFRAGAEGEVVRFESIPFYSPTCQAGGAFIPTDEFAPDDLVCTGQWGLHRAGFAQARQLAGVGAETVVALIDTGGESTHDLPYHARFWNAGDNGPEGGPFGNHGTACAGIVTAASSASAPGATAGVRILPIATATWADVDIAEGLYFAADSGARVMLMGFGVYESWRAWDFELVREALQYAHERGVVMVAAAGNENLPRARFPGSDARTLCVGGSNRSDERKHTLDDSSEKWWGACYGPDIDVVAPCLEMAATERPGAEGGARDDYFGSFNGTSSAAALVAGLAGLILNVNPALGGTQVRRLIERTCDKLSPSIYRYFEKESKPAGSWNSEVGYGCINAMRALRVARSANEAPTLSGAGERRESQSTCAPLPSPEPDPFMAFYESCVLDSATFRTGRRLQFRVVYEHGLGLVGRQEGYEVHRSSTLPGEQLTIEERDQSATGYAGLRTAFRKLVNVVSKARLAPEPPTGCLGAVLDSVRRSSGPTGFGGPLSKARQWHGSYETTLAGGASVRSACEAFTRSAVIASRAIAAERLLSISNPEHDMPGTNQIIMNRSSADAVTCFIRRVDEVYDIASRVVCVQWRTGDEPWRALDDLYGLRSELRELFDYTIPKLPSVGETVRGEGNILLPADGRCTQRRYPAPLENPGKRRSRNWEPYASAGAREGLPAEPSLVPNGDTATHEAPVQTRVSPGA